MEIPKCYGRGIYEYWKLNKDILKLISLGIQQEDLGPKILGGIFAGAITIKSILNIIAGHEELILLPSENCNNCRMLKGCFVSAIALLGDELNEESKN